MAIGSRRFHGLAVGRAEETDGELLERFVSRGDRAALDVLVERHAPMVWGVCARLLSRQDAEDAFQATFLVLLRKASDVRPRELVGNWLFGVARQTALNVRRQLAKRKTHEVQTADGFDAGYLPVPKDGELLAFLDQELARLPCRYRAAIVLCDLEGQSRKEAAQRLGLPEGTLASRQARGKAILARRLARHGLAVSALAVEAAFAKAAGLEVPVGALHLLLRNLPLLAYGQSLAGVVSDNILLLSERVMVTMFLTRLKLVVAVILATMLAAGGTVAIGYSVLAGDSPSQADRAKSEKAAPAKGDLDLLQGEWQTAELQPQPHPLVLLLGALPARYVFEKDSLTLIGEEGKPDVFMGTSHCKFKLAPAKSPKEIDITLLDGEDKGQVLKAIYKLDKGRLTLCWNNKDPAIRPTEFKAAAENGPVVQVLQRIQQPPPANGGAAGGIAALQQAKLDAAKDAYKDVAAAVNQVARNGNVLTPITRPDEVYTWSVRWLDAELALSLNKEARVKASEAHLKRMKELSVKVEKMAETILPKYQVSAAKWYVAEAELWLAKEKAK